MNDHQLNGVPILLWQTGLKKEKKFLTKEESCWSPWPNSGIVATSPMPLCRLNVPHYVLELLRKGPKIKLKEDNLTREFLHRRDDNGYLYR